MTRIYLIRHGQTEWNKQEIFRGLADVLLDETGWQEALALGKRLKETGIVAIISSPLLRAKETADIVGQSLGLETVISEGLIDINCGRWQGLTFREVMEKEGELCRIWLKEPHKFTFPQGESLAEVKQRSRRVMRDLVEEFPQKTIAVVSHRVINKVIICSLLDLPDSMFWSIKQDTAALNLFELSSTNFQLIFLNDTCHLREINEGVNKPDF